MVRSNGGPISGLVMEGNWLNGGNYCVYLIQDGDPLTDVLLKNNLFGRDFRYGPLSTGGTLQGLVITGNRWEDTGELMGINQ